MKSEESKMVKCQMMIRKPVKEVFEAFIYPKHTTNFWFSKSSGKLEKGKAATWEWEMYGHSIEINVTELLENELISIEWDSPPTTVDFKFESLGENQTYVTILQYGFHKEGEQFIESIKDSTGGFTTVLDGLKAYLEHNINLNLIADKYPQHLK